MTLPIPSTVYADNELVTAANLYTRIWSQINVIYNTGTSGPQGLVGFATGPGTTTNYTTLTTVCSVNVPVVNGRSYTVSAFASGTQNTSTSNPRVLCTDEAGQLSFFPALATSLSAGTSLNGGAENLYVATSTHTATFKLQASSTVAGTFSIVANVCQLIVCDVGT